MRAAFLAVLLAAPAAAGSSSKIPASALIEPPSLARRLRIEPAPLLLHVGFAPLYKIGHIPGSEYFGPGCKPEALAKLRARVKAEPRGREIVIYCGCCPWVHCPNIEPAYAALRALGFTRVKVLKIGRSFGQDWTDAGYPVAKGL